MVAFGRILTLIGALKLKSSSQTSKKEVKHIHNLNTVEIYSLLKSKLELPIIFPFSTICSSSIAMKLVRPSREATQNKKNLCFSYGFLTLNIINHGEVLTNINCFLWSYFSNPCISHCDKYNIRLA